MAKILIIDDVPTVRELIGQIVVDCGHTPYYGENGIQALTQAKLRKPDLIFLDVVMPKMDGFQVVRRFQRDPEIKKIPVVIVTSKNTATDSFYVKRIGASEHISKPFKPSDIQGAIEKFLGSTLAAGSDSS